MSSPALAYFLSTQSSVVALETIEISHPAFTTTYRCVRNAVDGVTVMVEDSSMQEFIYYPLAITELGDSPDLDFGVRIDLGDLGEVLPKELDAVSAASMLNIKPTVIYRVYRDDDLLSPIIGPLRLEARNFTFAAEGASFEAAAPYVNLNKTGETYNLTRFFTLRGFVK